MRSALLALTSMLVFASCKPQEPESAAPAASRELAEYFPLLPIIEKSLWSELLEAEGKLTVGPASGREAADREITRLAEKLRGRHPFKMDGNRLELGGIVCDKERGRISVPARVHYPNPGDERHPGELELLLCTEGGRLHETLFVTNARPLHLELMMHLAGHAKGPQGKRFRIDALTKTGARIPVDSLIRAIGGESLDSPLLWEFSGSDYKDLYAPDLSGDFAIFWHAHDSVLRADHEDIASGVVKLEAVPHSELKEGDAVILELIPAGK